MSALRTIGTIGWTNLIRFGRDRSNAFFVFVLPLGIIVLIGAQFGGGNQPRVGVVTHGSDVGRSTVQAMVGDNQVRVEIHDDRAALLLAIERGEIEAGIDLGPDPDGRLDRGEPLRADFALRANSNLGWLQSVVDEALSHATLEPSAVAFARRQGVPPATAEAAFARVGDVTALRVTSEAAGDDLFGEIDNAFEIGASSQLVLFMFLTGLTGSGALIQSRRLGITRRMLATPTSSATVIAGEALGRFAISATQGIYIVVVTALAFGVPWGDPVALVAVVVCFAAVSAGAAMVVGTVFDNDQQAQGAAIGFGLGLAALGGSMFPLELFGPTLRTIANVTPHAWANDALADSIRRDASVFEIAPQLAVLVGFAVALGSVAAWHMQPRR